VGRLRQRENGECARPTCRELKALLALAVSRGFRNVGRHQAKSGGIGGTAWRGKRVRADRVRAGRDRNERGATCVNK